MRCDVKGFISVLLKLQQNYSGGNAPLPPVNRQLLIGKAKSENRISKLLSPLPPSFDQRLELSGMIT